MAACFDGGLDYIHDKWMVACFLLCVRSAFMYVYDTFIIDIIMIQVHSEYKHA